MSVELSKFDNCDTMAEAFELLVGGQEDVRGTLQVASGTTKGSISICDGFIISVKINGQNLEPSVALQRLIALGESVFCFTEDPSLCRTEDDWQVRISSVLEGLSPDNSEIASASGVMDDSEDVITGDIPESAVEEVQKLNRLDADSKQDFVAESVMECETSAAEGDGDQLPLETDQQIKEQVANLADLLGRAISGDGDAPAEIDDVQPEIRSNKAPRIEFRDATASDTMSDPRRTYQSIKKPTIAGPKITGSFSKRSLEMPTVSTGEVVLPDLSTWTSTDGMTAVSAGSFDGAMSAPGEAHFDETLAEAPTSNDFDDLVIVNMASPQKVLAGGDAWKSAIGIDEDDSDETPPPDTVESITIAASIEQESTLSESQRELLKQVELLRDEDGFNEESDALKRQNAAVQEERIKADVDRAKYIVDPQTFNESSIELRLPQDEPVLSEEQLAVASRARVDGRSIEDRHDLLADAPSLDDRQKQLLDVVSELSDAEGFHETDAALEIKESLVIDESERKALENAARKLTPEQQKAEFAQFDGRLVEDEQKPEMREFVEYEALDQIPTPVVDDTLAAEVLPSDSDPLIAHAKDAKRRKNEGGLVGRIRDAIDRRKIAVYEGPLPTAGPNLSHLIAPTILCALCVALFTVPAMLRSSISRADSPRLAQDQMRLVVGQELNDSIPYAQHDPEKQPNPGSAGMINGVAPHVDSDSTYSSDSLMAARSLVSRGHETAAVKEYEDYLNANPDSVAGRLELINLYIKLGKKSQAKWHCLRGMKVKCAPSEFEQFWALWRQCMLN